MDDDDGALSSASDGTFTGITVRKLTDTGLEVVGGRQINKARSLLHLFVRGGALYGVLEDWSGPDRGFTIIALE